ncbi:MAG: hypothetical protein JW723_05265 [Bacteroidales bacterium]|nr:hypothetical protein [Bacteroidales bacterium]
MHFSEKIVFFCLICLVFQGCKKQEDSTVPIEISYEVRHVSSYGLHDGSINLTVSGGILPYVFAWSNGSDKEDLENMGAGIYSVTVMDAVDSSASADILITQPGSDSLISDIEGNIYHTIEIGDQTWMKENLKVTKSPQGSPISSYCYNDNPDYHSTYGRLYTWDVIMNGSVTEMAQGICPDGWHIPSDGEWKELEIFLGMTNEEADMVNTWRGEGVGTSLIKGGNSGYEAILAGRRSDNGYYSLLDKFEYIWTSTEYGDYAWRRCLSSTDSRVGRWNTFPKTYAFSVRCIKDQ